MRNVQRTFTDIVEQVPYLPEELQLAVANIEDPCALSHLIAGALRIKIEEKQQLLEEPDVAKRLRRLSEILARELEVVAIGPKIQSQVAVRARPLPARVLPAPAAQGHPGGAGRGRRVQAEVEELREQLDAPELPEEVRRQADRELSRLERLPPAAAEHGVIRSYLEWIASLPWGKATEDNLDLAHARKVLDEDHYDIEEVKDRILEFLAVRKLKPDAQAARSCASSARPAWARPRWAARSPARSGESSSASASAACATRPRSAATGAPTSARCPGRSSGRCATPGSTTRCS